ncbi:hypothetical protein AMJ40_03200 [candidate division TA06 bacterium DG_26]|uniref:EamA domain-containing protein n=1 Tax=candidate division TA06 bacterium DG_26 TaxID=1703771 RepID=A0A0S7WJQ7_UNCT6|nr:MAG: hypothetical protein AMJ40_03200 [candidate division TA06 bacterium DG_26]
MNWILFLVLNSGLNSLWGALSKRRLKQVSSVSFSLVFRAMVLPLLVIPAAIHFQLPGDPAFWLSASCSGVVGAMLTASVLEGFREDYYSTYALRNTSPLFTWILAVTFLKEPINGWVILGTLGVVGGSCFFYRSGKFSRYGLAGAVLVGINSILHKIGVSVSSAYIYPLFSYSFSIGALGLYSLFHPRRRANVRVAAKSWRDIFPLSILAFFAVIFGFLAISLAPITWVAPVARLRLVSGFLLSYFYLRERYRWRDRLIGGMLILAGAGVIAVVAT